MNRAGKQQVLSGKKPGPGQVAVSDFSTDAGGRGGEHSDCVVADCDAEANADSAEPEPEPLGQFARSRTQSRILKVGRLQLRERLSATHIKHIEQRQA